MVSKIRAAVFFGGPSVEHEVSVITAMQAIQAMDSEKYQVIPVYTTKTGDLYTGEHLSSLESYRNIPEALKQAQKVVLQKEGKDVVLMLAKQKRFGSSIVAALDVALPIYHGTGGEGQRKGQDCLHFGYQQRPQDTGDGFHHAGGLPQKETISAGMALPTQGQGHRCSLGEILQTDPHSDTDCSR